MGKAYGMVGTPGPSEGQRGAGQDASGKWGQEAVCTAPSDSPDGVGPGEEGNALFPQVPPLPVPSRHPSGCARPKARAKELVMCSEQTPAVQQDREGVHWVWRAACTLPGSRLLEDWPGLAPSRPAAPIQRPADCGAGCMS